MAFKFKFPAQTLFFSSTHIHNGLLYNFTWTSNSYLKLKKILRNTDLLLKFLCM